MWPFTRKRRQTARPQSVPSASTPPSTRPFALGTPDQNGMVQVTPNAPTQDDVLSFLQRLPEDRELFFFDAFDGGGVNDSDPGSYVSVRRRDQEFAFQRGNHGWSSRWRLVPVEEIAALMLRNIEEPQANDPRAFLRSMRQIRLSAAHRPFGSLDFA